MKGFNLSCASSAATAISMATDQRSPSIHHHRSRGNPFSNLPQLSPLKPKRNQAKNHKSSASDRPIDPISPPGSTRYLLDDEAMLDGSSDVPEFLMRSQSMKSLASSSHDTSSISSSSTTSGGPRCRPPLVIDPMRFRSVEPGESPVLCVSRYKASSTIDRTRFQSVEAAEESPVLKTPVVSASTSSSDKQVVVLRVSLHCRGCEGKVRKHISRMKGVTSFNIDFAAKKVTVIGDVTPLGVLASISRVKNAQLWPSSASVSGK